MSVTVVIPTHNRPALLREAVESALTASPPDGEVLVVDDRSEPPAVQSLDDINDPRLRGIVSTEMPGASGSRNAGILEARHEIVAFLDDDDLMRPGHLTRVLDITRQTPEAAWGFSNALWRDVASGADEPEDLPLAEGFVPDVKIPRYTLASAGRSLWCRRKALIEVGLFDLDWRIDEDADLCLRLIFAGYRPWFSPEPGIIARTNRAPDSNTAQITERIASDHRARAYCQTYERHARHFPALSRGRWFLATRFLRRAAKDGQSALAARTVLRREPLALVLLAYLGFKTLRHYRAS
ncbi:glycosyltransferase [Alphaproteobacteria bacterium GH1-50]|uniref:Glycosyltransferase n=1 Tax=Kangsaoukella pontilimi TaxID=2691042 RepID=A0A7C9IF01_9RHOB|nr:glycosyltransferase family A protein [Kangsaoukella pontilimi]MXQ07007.1 glycosyltransferase [Kangsaoukella pontilimi]